jgi:hypothetical protein
MHLDVWDLCVDDGRGLGEGSSGVEMFRRLRRDRKRLRDLFLRCDNVLRLESVDGEYLFEIRF